MEKKIGIITFHNSYNCGSMLESYALQKYLEKNNINSEIIDYSTEGQKKLYSVFEKNNSLKNCIKNIILFFHKKRIKKNNALYEKFKNENFNLSKKYTKEELLKSDYDIVIAGSDQVWNITIEDFDFSYMVDFSEKCKKIAYAPSFGAKNPKKYASQEEYKKIQLLLSKFNQISIREKNGKKWLKDNFDINAEVLLDPTLLLTKTDYEKIEEEKNPYKSQDYIFLYCPSFNIEVCKLVRTISKKYNMKVITWSSKSYFKKGIKRFGFELVEYETPSLYLKLIHDARLVITTSFHGTIFSAIYNKSFFTIKNGEMYGDDDRVRTLVENLKLTDRLIETKFDEKYDYLMPVNYTGYNEMLPIYQEKSKKYLMDSLRN